MGKFVVVAWESPGWALKEIEEVEASTAEQAIGLMAAKHSDWLEPTVYEAWPRGDPKDKVRITI